MPAMTAGLAKAAKRPVGEGKQALLSALSARFGDRFSMSQALREQHANTLTWLACEPPDAVVFAETEAEVSEVVKLCAASRVPIIPFGTGTSLEGHVNAPFGGVSVDLSRMNRIIAVHEADLDCTVEPGVTRKALNEHLRDSGLFFPVDPGADASLGGMAATRASGTNAVRYGTMRDLVLGLSAVLADGSIIKTGSRARKSSSGYDLTRLFVGSEGTLGVITELTLRLYGRPEAVRAAVCPFESMAGAANTVIQTIQLGIPVARIEIIDEVQLRVCNAYSKTDYPLAPTLFFEFHGTSEVAVEDQIRSVEEIAREHGAKGFKWASSLEDRNTLWQARHNAYYATVASRPGARAWTTDICVPISHLAECILETQQDLKDANVVAPLVGHAGDGNFHLIIMLDPSDPKEFATVTRISERLVERALKFNGTCSGEHGVGFGKLKYLSAEHGEALDVMRAIKRAIDPGNLMNPGKLIPEVGS